MRVGIRAAFVGAVVVMSVPGPAIAEPALDAAEAMSLQDLFAVAVRSAPELEQAAFAASAAAAAADATAGIEDWTVAGAGSVALVAGAPTDIRPTSNESLVATGVIGLRKLLPTNGTLELLSATRRDEASQDDVQQSKFVTSSAIVRLTQPLLRDAGSTARTATMRRARHVRDAEQIRRAAVARVYAVRVVDAYWNLALAWRRLEVRRAGLDTARQQLARMRTISTTAIAASELIPIEQAIATRELDIATAELDVLDRSMRLRAIVGLPVSADSLAIRPGVPLAAPATTPTIEIRGAVARALDNSDELKASAELLASARVGIAAAARDLLPRLDVRFEGGAVGTARTTTGALGSLGALDGYTVSTTLSFEMPIGRTEARARDAAQRIESTRLEHETHDLRNQITAATVQAVYAVRATRVALDHGARAIELATANLEAEQKKLEFGKSTTQEIVRRQDDLEQLRLTHATAAALHLVALARLDALAGDILATHGLTIRSRQSVTSTK